VASFAADSRFRFEVADLAIESSFRSQQF